MDKPVYLYTDGACKGNPGAGGWGVFMRYGTHEKELFGGETETTNNRMELTAVIEGLKSLKRRCQVVICTDSQYVSPVFPTPPPGRHRQRRSPRPRAAERECRHPPGPFLGATRRSLTTQAGTSSSRQLRCHVPAYGRRSIDEGEYGFCADTGEPIGLKRLLQRDRKSVV